MGLTGSADTAQDEQPRQRDELPQRTRRERTTMDNYDWLQAIDDHPHTTTEDVSAAYHDIGTETGLTPEQLDRHTFRLQLLGFLKVVDISDDGRTYTYNHQRRGHPGQELTKFRRR